MAPSESSLKRTLLFWLLPPLLLLAAAGSFLQYTLVSRPALETLDRQLGDVALALARLYWWEDGKLGFSVSAQTEESLRTDQMDQIFYAALGPDGRLLSGDPPLAAVAAASSEGVPVQHFDATVQGLPVRVVVRSVPCGDASALTCEVRVAETLHKRRAMLRDALVGAGASLLVLAIAVMVFVYYGIEFGLRPLRRLTQQIAGRSFDDLRPVAEPGIPSEIAPVVDAVNRLLHRLGQAARAQRAFLADAAHQLRTPLTTMRTETELALLEEHPQAMHPTLMRLRKAAVRAGRLATQLLSMARAEGTAQAGAQPEPFDLRQVGADVAEEWTPRAIADGIDLGFVLAPAPIIGRRALLHELASNLVDNALEHGAPDGRITVRTGVRDGRAFLEVEDDGPGIPVAERERVLERFYRGADARGAGSGLGLAIVADIARTHGTRPELLEPESGSGLLVRLQFMLDHAAWDRLAFERPTQRAAADETAAEAEAG